MSRWERGGERMLLLEEIKILIEGERERERQKGRETEREGEK